MFTKHHETLSFRPMNPGDIPIALQIIEDHDEDDFEEAQQTYNRGLDGQFALLDKGRVVGVTGAKPIPNTDRSYGISWTYLQRNLIGQGLGRFMLDSLVEYMQSEGGRKAFVTSSDYYDPELRDIYRDAHDAYRGAGFVEELRHPHYYDRDETMLGFGMRLEPKIDAAVEMNESNIKLTDIDEIPECDGAYWLAWELGDPGTDPAGFRKIVEQVADWDGRVIFMAFPSDLVRSRDFAFQGQFREEGRLLDYYEDGVDEVHYRFDLRL